MENLMSHPSYSNNYMYKFSRLIGFYATSMLITIKWIWLFKYPHVQWGHDEVLAR